MSKKHTIEEVNETVKKMGYELISKEYKNNKQKIELKDKEGYYYSVEYNSLANCNVTPDKFNKSNPYTIQNIGLWVKNNNKLFKLIEDQLYIGSGKKLRWQCLKDGCKEIFELAWAQVYQGIGCGYCAGKKVGLSNCLATKFPNLVKEFHLTKNGILTPYNILPGSTKEVWWKCSKNPKHEWHISPNNRTSSNTGCPYCAGQLPSEDYNLLVVNPELCKEWDYEKNKKRPEDYCPNSGKSVFWICIDCSHTWEATICNRNKENGTNCPECSKSHGEKQLKKVLDLYNLYFIQQKEFEGLLGLGNKNLSYDFYILKYNLLIEYQGIQHEKYVKGLHKSKKDFEKQLEHDKRKREYAEKNNIRLLEIWYYDFDKIEEILLKELNILI